MGIPSTERVVGKWTMSSCKSPKDLLSLFASAPDDVDDDNGGCEVSNDNSTPRKKANITSQNEWRNWRQSFSWKKSKNRVLFREGMRERQFATRKKRLVRKKNWSIGMTPACRGKSGFKFPKKKKFQKKARKFLVIYGLFMQFLFCMKVKTSSLRRIDVFLGLWLFRQTGRDQRKKNSWEFEWVPPAVLILNLKECI